jgi:hypothetical protein
MASSYHKVYLITHNDASQSVGLLWTSDQLVADIIIIIIIISETRKSKHKELFREKNTEISGSLF